MINDEEQKKKDRASGKLLKTSDLADAGLTGQTPAGYVPTEETYVPTEREYQRNNPNSAEYKADVEKEKQKRLDRENKRTEKVNRLKASHPWLFGYGTGAFVQQGLGAGSLG